MSEHYIASLIESFRKEWEAAHAADRAWEAKEKALEAENVRLRRQFSKLSQKLADYTFLPDTNFPAFENGKETGYWDAHEQIEAILNREQEQQP